MRPASAGARRLPIRSPSGEIARNSPRPIPTIFPQTLERDRDLARPQHLDASRTLVDPGNRSHRARGILPEQLAGLARDGLLEPGEIAVPAATHPSSAVDQNDGREAADPERLVDGGIVLADGQGETDRLDRGPDGRGAFLAVDRDGHEAAVLLCRVQLLELRKLGETRRAPRRPEIDEQDAAPGGRERELATVDHRDSNVGEGRKPDLG
ncbi:MAG: hypothetical protein R3344_08955 [Acidobacteriota bacterium]|nr:hypothetical protein [Acidobacteriota bacterium]